MKLDKKIRLRAYLYALKHIKQGEFICWQLENYLIKTKRIQRYSIDYNTIILWFPELWNRRTLRVKQGDSSVYYPSNRTDLRRNVLRKCIKDLKPKNEKA